YLQDGRRRWKSTRSKHKRDALKALTRLRDVLKEKPQDPLLSEFISEYIPHVRTSLAPRTVDGYEAALRSLLAFVGDRVLSEVSRRHVDGYISSRLKIIKPVTVNIELRSLRAGFGVAEKWGLVEKSPFSGVKQVKVAAQTPAYLGRADLKVLLDIIKEEWLKGLVVFAIATGMRQGEMLNLRWQDVDLERRVIHIQSSSTFMTKHGMKRSIPMSDLVLSLLTATRRDEACKYVFSRRGQKIGASYMAHLFKRYVRLAKLDDRLHWHSLRHTHASWLVQGGVSLYQVQQLLGHSDSRTTQIYSHLSPSELHGAVNKIQLPTD
ncbi:MAG: site-specific integrase, partial [Bacteroidota bacterium]